MSERSRTYRKQKVCVVCGKPIPYYKRSYCSDECTKEARRRQMKNDRKNAREMGVKYEEYIKGIET